MSSRKPDAKPRNGIRSYRAIALTSVMSTWIATCVQNLAQDNELEGCKQLHVGVVDGMGCQHFQVMITQHLQKTLGGGRRTERKTHGKAVRNHHDVHCKLGNQDDLFYVTRPKHIASILGEQGAHV